VIKWRAFVTVLNMEEINALTALLSSVSYYN